jgi:lipase
MTPLHVHRYGDPSGPPVLAIHGITAHGARFRRLAEEALADRCWIAPDLRGHGRSPAEPPWGLEQHVVDLLATVQDAGWDTFDVVGHSLGAELAIHLIAAAPERLRRVVLLDPPLVLSPATALANAEATLADAGFATDHDAAVARSAGLAGVEDGGVHAAVPEEIAAHLARGEDGRFRWRYHRAAVVALWGEIPRPLPRLPAVPPPTLLVGARRAPLVDDASAASLAARFGGSLTVEWVDGGHMVYWDCFDETAALVAGFLAGRDRRASR